MATNIENMMKTIKSRRMLLRTKVRSQRWGGDTLKNKEDQQDGDDNDNDDHDKHEGINQDEGEAKDH